MLVGEAKSKDGLPVLILGLSMDSLTRLGTNGVLRVTPEKMAKLGLPEMEVLLYYAYSDEELIGILQVSMDATRIE